MKQLFKKLLLLAAVCAPIPIKAAIFYTPQSLLIDTIQLYRPLDINIGLSGGLLMKQGAKLELNHEN